MELPQDRVAALTSEILEHTPNGVLLVDRQTLIRFVNPEFPKMFHCEGERLLGRPARVAITDKSGADGVAHWVNEFFGLKGEDRINKIKVHKLARWVIDQYDVEGRLTAISDQELEAKAKEFFPDYWDKYIASQK